MNWGEIGTQIIIGIVGTLLSALGLFVTYLINKYIKDDKAKTLASSLSKLVQDCVLQTYQTYVQCLKKSGKFDEEAQKEALNHCLALINKNMPAELGAWLSENYSDIQGYLTTLIEARIGLLKNQAKKEG